MDVLPVNTVKREGGMFNTFRMLGMFNLLSEKAKLRQQSWYVATEYPYTDSYFDNPGHFNRFNIFTKYNGRISNNTWLNFSVSTPGRIYSTSRRFRMMVGGVCPSNRYDPETVLCLR